MHTHTRTHTHTPTHTRTHTHTHTHTVSKMQKAAEAASTYLAMEPSDEVMANNIRFYTAKFRMEAEAFTPRQVSIVLTQLVS